MKKLSLNPIYIFLFFAFTLSGCSEYQYIGLKEKAPQSPTSFVSENDTVKVSYQFTGTNCPVTITVFNKLNKPIYIDWSQSSVIMNGNRTALWSNNAVINGSTSSVQLNWSKNISTSGGDFEGILYKDEKVSFLPPHSYIRVTRVHLKNQFFKDLDRKKSKAINLTTESGDNSGRLYSFTDQNAPLKFRIFLSISTDKEFSKPLYMENSFWTNEVTQSYTKPQLLVNRQNNQCHVRKTTGFGTFVGVVLGLGLLTVAAALPK
ncbi:MAG: hypothetical protein JXR71_09875 [Bacteroidales bacterium]|nr:hypothetical protein [Bacteroidales bacterium]